MATGIQAQLTKYLSDAYPRLNELGGSPSKLKDAAMRLGALNWNAFFQGHLDTPALEAVGVRVP